MISRSISNECTFNNFENFNPIRLNRADSNDDCSNSSVDSRSNSIIEEENSKEYIYTSSKPIQIPSQCKARKREVNYDGKTTSDKRCLTPTPTKYYIQIQENIQKIRNMFTSNTN
jgi:hypothetical protein